MGIAGRLTPILCSPVMPLARGGRLGLAALACAALTGCGASPVNDERVCQTPAPIEAPLKGIVTAAETAPAANALACVHRWAYRLAGSDDPADVVARAATAACRDPIELWRAQENFPTASREDRIHERALFHVVQARAGHCLIPS